MMARARARRSTLGRSSYRHSPVEIFLRPQQSWWAQILGLVIRVRAELTIAVVLLMARFWAWPRFDTWAGHTTALLIVTALVLSMLVIPTFRRFWLRRWWCVTTRHRLRACYLQTRTMTYDGKLPYLLWSRPSPVGERVRVWLPAGLAVKDLDESRLEAAAACWAADVRVTPSRRQAALAVVDIIRHDLLTGDALRPQMIDTVDPVDPIGPAGPAREDDQLISSTGTAGPFPSWDTPLPPVAPPTRPTTDGHRTDGHNADGSNGNGAPAGRPRTRKDPAPAGPPAATDPPPVPGFGGVDVSDYV